MKEHFQVPVSLLVPSVLGAFALTFIAGGIYYLEQRVSRIRDQFPKQGPLATLTGYAALSIGVLMAISVAGYFITSSSDFGMGALVASVAGFGFWVYRIYVDQTLLSRIRDGALAFICAALIVLTGWWVGVSL